MFQEIESCDSGLYFRQVLIYFHSIFISVLFKYLVFLKVLRNWSFVVSKTEVEIKRNGLFVSNTLEIDEP